MRKTAGSIWKNLSRFPFAAALALIAVIAGVRAFIEPDSLPLNAVIGEWSYAWAVMYGVGGILILLGLGQAKPRWEALGCVWFATGTTIQAVVILFFLGQSAFLTIWNVISLAVFSVAGIVRTRNLVKGQTTILIEGRAPDGV
jgi:hypothetical protein